MNPKNTIRTGIVIEILVFNLITFGSTMYPMP